MVLSKELAHKDSNLEMTESESVALPFGDGPLFYVVCRVDHSTMAIIHTLIRLVNTFFKKLLFLCR